MSHETSGGSYFEAILVAIRSAGQRMAAVGGYLGSAEQAAAPGWKWQLLTAAGREHAEATARLDEADERLRRLGTAGNLPAPLDQLPQRLQAMRTDLRAAEDRLQQALAEAIATPFGKA